ncbi:MAG: hypothetical protein VCA38_00420 [Roseibacillus sp.]|jgi:hypothetical protein
MDEAAETGVLGVFRAQLGPAVEEFLASHKIKRSAFSLAHFPGLMRKF